MSNAVYDKELKDKLKEMSEQMITTTKLRQKETLEAAVSTEAGIVWIKLLM